MSNSTNSTKRDWAGHVMAWLAGICLALTAFVNEWELAPQIPARLGNGQFAFNLIIFGFLFFLGGVTGGYWWRFCRWLRGDYSPVLLTIATVFFLYTITNLLGIISTDFFYYISISSIFLLIGIIYAFVKRTKSKPKKSSFMRWPREDHRCNILFFIFLFLALSVNNATAILKLEITTTEAISAIVGRVFFSAFIAGCFYLLTELSSRATPHRLRWTLWCILAVIPIFIINDMLLSQLYGRSQIELLNSLTVTGEIDLIKELKGVGVEAITPFLAVLIILLGLAVAVGVAYLLWNLSCKMKKTSSLRYGLIVTALFFALSVAEQVIGKQWKQLYSWQQEYKTFILHQGIASPKLGLADFRVSFKEYSSRIYEIPESHVEKVRPDIYFIMVESFRHDAMSEKTTPFLTEFSKECQTLKSTWSASNATHLSWFSLFYSKPSLFWMDELDAIPNREDFAGSPILGTMQNMGYNFEIRAVCDLGYKDFGLLNFGTDNKLYSKLEHCVNDNEMNDLGLADREKLIFQQVKDSVKQCNTPGGNFYYLALDSPHYNYYWDKDFQVPYSEYKEGISFPLFPTKKEVVLYHNRYRNSVAWVDHQVKEFCDFLKTNDLYDNAIIIVTGDHGEEFQEQGGWCHCTSIMPEQTNVPILIKWPVSMGKVPTHELASHQDIMPSILAYLEAPEESFSTMAGKNLLEPDTSQTQLISTAFANKTGETMILKRNGYTAFFSWNRPWEPRVPSEMRLERIETSSGPMPIKKDEDLGNKLRELFPDAFDRYFSSLETIN